MTAPPPPPLKSKPKGFLAKAAAASAIVKPEIPVSAQFTSLSFSSAADAKETLSAAIGIRPPYDDAIPANVKAVLNAPGFAGNIDAPLVIHDNIRGTIDEGNTALHMSSRSERSPAIAVILLEAGADPNVTNNKGMTPLRIAVEPLVKGYYSRAEEPGQKAMITAFLSAAKGKADPNIRDHDGVAVLHAAIAYGNVPAMEALATCPNLDWHLKTVRGQTPLELAVGNQAIVGLVNTMSKKTNPPGTLSSSSSAGAAPVADSDLIKLVTMMADMMANETRFDDKRVPLRQLSFALKEKHGI